MKVTKRITKRFFDSTATITVSMALMAASCFAFSDEVNSTASESASLAETQAVVADFRTIDTQVLAIEPNASATNNDALSNSDVSKVDAKDIVDAALGPGAFERYRLADSAQGYFTDTEQQSLHVIVNRNVTAVAKEVTPSILVIFQDNKPITQFVPPKASYLNIASVLDVDKDGLNEVLLTANAYQMGSLFVAADVYSFENSDDILKQEIGAVYVNACDSAVADNQQVRASVLFTIHDTNELIAENYIAPCEKNSESPSVELSP